LWHFVKEGHLKFTAKGIAENDLEWQTFYLMSKGVPRNEALVMTLGSINKDVGWFEPTEDKGSQWWRFQATGLTPMQKEELLVGLPPGSIG
jgi:hypothetical protein